jgi:hypothetical protein
MSNSPTAAHSRFYQFQVKWANHILVCGNQDMSHAHIDICMRVLLKNTNQEDSPAERERLWKTYKERLSRKSTDEDNPGFGRLMGLTPDQLFAAFESGMEVSYSLCSGVEISETELLFRVFG